VTASLNLGAQLPWGESAVSTPLRVPAHHLVTHGVIVGMTGSGKTGLVTVVIEEALRTRVPVLVVDVKGDLTNLLLAFPSFDAQAIEPWTSTLLSPADTRTTSELAVHLADQRRKGLEGWGISEAMLAAYARSIAVRVISPGSSAGEPLHVLSSLERGSARWESDPESARGALSAAVSLLLRLLGRDPGPAKSKEHVLLSILAEARLVRGAPSDLSSLLADLADPPTSHVGALELDAFLPKSERRSLAAALNTLLASRTFASWRQGNTLDVGAWMRPTEHGRTPAIVVSVAHLDDDERALVLGVLLEEVLWWVRWLPGTQSLRALLVFDEVFGFLPPHPANPPTKRPLVPDDAVREPGRARPGLKSRGIVVFIAPSGFYDGHGRPDLAHGPPRRARRPGGCHAAAAVCAAGGA
jgi:hypothetical protein